MLGYALEAAGILDSGDIKQPEIFRRIDDGIIVVQVLLLIPVTLALYHLGRASTAGLSRVALASGRAGMLAVAVIQLLYVLRAITVREQTALVLPAWAVVGLWLVLANQLGRAGGALPPGLAWLGSAAGIGWILLLAGSFAFGVPSSVATSNSAAIVGNYPLMISMGLGLLLGYLGLPIWSIWLGRQLLARRALGPSASPP